MAETNIEWCSAVWNPVRGCARVSAGCGDGRGGGCYAERQAIRQAGPGGNYEGLVRSTANGPRWTGKIRCVPALLDQPLRWRKPRRIFVNSMSDLFHEGVPDEFIDRVFAVMALASHHTFQVLTKRPERMREWFAWRDDHRGLIRQGAVQNQLDFRSTTPRTCLGDVGWPLPNVHLGVSVEDQATADERISQLFETPAAVRFVSAEPLLGPIYLGGEYLTAKFGGRYPFPTLPDEHRTKFVHLLDWVIVGGESGPRARPCDVAWIRSIVEQCRAAGVPVFCKQLGADPYEMVGGGNHGGDYFHEPRAIRLRDRKGGAMAEWPEDLRVREFPR